MNRDSPLRHFHCHTLWPVIGIPDRGITLVIAEFSAAQFTLNFKGGEVLIEMLDSIGFEVNKHHGA